MMHISILYTDTFDFSITLVTSVFNVKLVEVSFYICLIVMAVCNRKVKGSDLVGEHERSLQELFPMEAPSLLAYDEMLGV